MKLDTISIKGKNYVMVNTRIKAFRELPEYKGYSLETEIVKLTDDECVMKAVIKDENGVVKANGTAWELKNNSSSTVNKTSFIENCETSAWGRALGNLGIGVDENIASAEEVLNAIAQQNGIAVSTPKSAPQPTNPEPTEISNATPKQAAQDEYMEIVHALEYGVQGNKSVKKLRAMTDDEIELCRKSSNQTVREMAEIVSKAMDEDKVFYNDGTGFLDIVPF